MRNTDCVWVFGASICPVREGFTCCGTNTKTRAQKHHKLLQIERLFWEKSLMLIFTLERCSIFSLARIWISLGFAFLDNKTAVYYQKEPIFEYNIFHTWPIHRTVYKWGIEIKFGNILPKKEYREPSIYHWWFKTCGVLFEACWWYLRQTCACVWVCVSQTH